MANMNPNETNYKENSADFIPASNKTEWNFPQKTSDFLVMIDIGHSLFALPFAYLGAVLAVGGLPSLYSLWWITLAMVGARTAALCLNRIIDRHIDTRNPRTAHWILPQKKLSLFLVRGAVAVSLFLLFYSASNLNLLCVQLAPLAVIGLMLYSYTKRFTWTCHVILGLIIGLSPLGAWIAMTESIALIPVLLWLAVAFWIAGFDTMYACQDEQFDHQEGLYSIPARFGTPKALRISAFFHVLTLILLFGIGLLQPSLGWLYAFGIGIVALLLIYEHILVTPTTLDKSETLAFRLNQYVSLVLFIFTLADLIWV